MYQTLLGLVMTLGVAQVCAQPARKSDGARSTVAAKPAPAAQGITIPKDAVEVELGLWRHKDPKGKVWHYRKTPFGVRKFEPVPEEEARASESKLSAQEARYMTAVEREETIEFERKTPFGSSKWSRKKTDELTQAERIAWERSKQQ